MDYDGLLQQARANIQTADFTALREASTQPATYDPYNRSFPQKEFAEAIRASDWQTALNIGSAALEKDFLHIEGHFGMAFCYKQAGKTAHEQWHGRFAAGLLRSILGSGDGQTMSTAYRVLYFREVYDVLGALRLRLVRQSLMHQDSQAYDRMECTNQDGSPLAVYFNITAYFGYEFRQRGDS